MLPISPFNPNLKTPAVSDRRTTGKARRPSWDPVGGVEYIISKESIENDRPLEMVADHPEFNMMDDHELLYRKLSLGPMLYQIHDPKAFLRGMSQFDPAKELVSSFKGIIPVATM